MDPNATLRDLRHLAKLAIDDGLAVEQATYFGELFEALDEWLKRGGFLPEEWQH